MKRYEATVYREGGPVPCTYDVELPGQLHIIEQGIQLLTWTAEISTADAPRLVHFSRALPITLVAVFPGRIAYVLRVRTAGVRLTIARSTDLYPPPPGGVHIAFSPGDAGMWYAGHDCTELWAPYFPPELVALATMAGSGLQPEG